MAERDVEARFVKGVKKRGGVAYKFVSPGNNGVPDRMVVMPGGRVAFIELKTETGRLRTDQIAQLRRLDKLGQATAVLYGDKDVDDWLERLDRGEVWR